MISGVNICSVIFFHKFRLPKFKSKKHLFMQKLFISPPKNNYIFLREFSTYSQNSPTKPNFEKYFVNKATASNNKNLNYGILAPSYLIFEFTLALLLSQLLLHMFKKGTKNFKLKFRV